MTRYLPIVVLSATLLSGTAWAQRLRVVVPVGGGAIAAKTDPEDEGGVTVELFENPNLDRYLRKAQDFLVKENYPAAIKVLQDVIEGRTIEAADSMGAPESPPAGEPTAADQPKDGAQPKPTDPKVTPKPKDNAKGAETGPMTVLDPSQAVFSQDGRLYRPVRRLCHELLAAMPQVGVDLYQSEFEVAAEELLGAAVRQGGASALERVANRYFITLAAGRAMVALADQFMHQARYRAAVQVLRDLIEVYPEQNRRKLGISEVWCRYKIALCMRLAGEVGAARDAAQAVATAFPDESLRIMGELQPVRELPDSALFRAADGSLVADTETRVDRSLRWLVPDVGDLIPLWQFRYFDQEPYRTVRSSNNENNNNFMGEGQVVTAAPHASKNDVSTRLAFFGKDFPADRVVLHDHYRMRVLDAFSGLLLREGDGDVDIKTRPKPNNPRVRVPAYDFALFRPVEDERRYYTILGYNKTSSNDEVLRANTLVAHDRGSMARAWASTDWHEGEDGLKDVTFLAAPTVFGERLLAPVLRRGAYSLQCLDRATGKPLWRTRVHAGGSPFFKAPGAPVRVQGGVAYMLTNGGGLAAVDAFAGDLKWVRRYERRDPLRPRGKVRSSQREAEYGTRFVERDLPSFLPSDPVLVEGMVIFAPCDGDMLLCIDGASAQPLWMLDGRETRYAQYGPLQSIVGANSRHLFVTSETELICIGLRSGSRLWSKSLPSADQTMTRWRGRGVVLEDYVLMPHSRAVLVLPTDGKSDWQQLSLPPLTQGQEPLRGPCSLFVSGPWLGVAYQGGVEVYSTAAALTALAAAAKDPLTRARYQAQAGETDAAIATLEQLLAAPNLAAEVHLRAATRLLSLGRERALLLAGNGRRDDAVALLDRVRPFALDRTVRMNWHLARLDLWKQIPDLRAYADEQQSLYRYMEGKE